MRQDDESRRTNCSHSQQDRMVLLHYLFDPGDDDDVQHLSRVRDHQNSTGGSCGTPNGSPHHAITARHIRLTYQSRTFDE